MKHCTCNSLPDAGRRSFFASAASAVAAAGVIATSAMAAEPARAQPAPLGGQRKFMEEAARLAIESVEKGWGGPFGAVITRDGEIIGRGQNRVLLKGCEIYITGAPCAMCMSAIYWSRIDHVYFASTLTDTSAIGFDDAYQYEDFAKPWDKRRIAVSEAFERDLGLKAFKAWTDKKDRHQY
jgi:tRNA(Arg) A34 adenosine deaminase TadA